MENKKIILPVLAKHFHNAVFADNRNCAISKAAMEFFGVEDVSEGVDSLHVGSIRYYRHADYSARMFDSDARQAKLLGYNETIIFKLELIPYGENIDV